MKTRSSTRTARSHQAGAVRFVSWQRSQSSSAGQNDVSQLSQEDANPSVARRARALVQLIRDSPLPPARAWDAAFQQRKYASPVLAEAIYVLHRSQDYDIAVEGLLSALRNDHAQPWTYDILATEMALAGRPQKEIERVLVSRVDFTNSSLSQMMLTAAMLSRMDAREPAMKLCRQAAEMQPFMPEPWLLGRKIADNTEDDQSRAWFRLGILRHALEPRFAADRREAREELEAQIEAAEKQGDRRRVSELRESLREATHVDLRIRLRWVGRADLDLIVTEPDGSRCDLRQRLTENGGQLVQDDGGFGERQNGQRVEEYVCHSAPSGDYTAAVRFVFGNVVAGNAVLEIIQHEGTPMESRRTETVPLSREDAEFTFPLRGGRGQ